MPKKFLLSETGDRGWFVGGFDRAAHRTTDLEAAFQTNYPGEISEAHYHKIATEINLITRGRVRINGEIYTAGMGLILYPGDVGECEYLEETDTFVIKVPGPLNDKYLYEPRNAQINEGQKETSSGPKRSTPTELDEP